jgi:hypothetical protein
VSKFLQSKFVRSGFVNPFGLSAPAAGAAAGPASYIFNGTDEALTRTLSTSGAATTIATYSLWVKIDAFVAGYAAFFQVINEPTDTNYISGYILSNGLAVLVQDDGSNDFADASAIPADPTGVWVHLVFRYDSTQGTAADRVRIYHNGSLLADTPADPPGENEPQALFADTRQHQIGAFLDAGDHFDGKMAFIDVLEGVSAAPTDFAFDDGGTWTRMPYAGSYGTYGFSLDGTDGFNDVSGNGQHFSGVNMTIGDNLDDADLPPYTS